MVWWFTVASQVEGPVFEFTSQPGAFLCKVCMFVGDTKLSIGLRVNGLSQYITLVTAGIGSCTPVILTRKSG